VRYRAGQRVRVAARKHDGHHRTPGYVKGKTGSVERVHASFTNPETRAYGKDGLPKQPLYLVGFAQRDVGPDSRGQAGDRIYVDVFEHWLEPLDSR
jgi:nitrile hydratase